MSTRATIHFHYQNEAKPEAIVYRHHDGYPKETGVDITRFIKRLEKLDDTRFSDPTILAARYVVYLAEQFATDFKGKKSMRLVRRKERLDFLSVRVLIEDPWDIEYRYVVRCFPKRKPSVSCYAVRYDDNTATWVEKKVSIPRKGLTYV